MVAGGGLATSKSARTSTAFRPRFSKRTCTRDGEWLTKREPLGSSMRLTSTSYAATPGFPPETSIAYLSLSGETFREARRGCP